MSSISPSSERAYCAFVSRRIAEPPEWREPVEGQFRCVAEPGSPARARPEARRTEVTVAGLNRGDGLDEWLATGVFAAPLLDDSGRVTCAKIQVEAGPGGARTLVWPAVGGRAETRYPFELRSGVLRFSDAATGAFDDWLVGDEEYAGGAIYVRGAPWFPGDLECTTSAPALRPLPRPMSGGGLSDRDLGDVEARRRSLVHDDRVMFLRPPAGGDREPMSRCARVGLGVGFGVDGKGATARPGTSAVLRVEAEEGDRFYLISEYSPQGLAFVSAAEGVSGAAGLIPTGLLPIRRDAEGWHIGGATLHFEEQACEAEPPRAAFEEASPVFRRGVFAAWIAFVRAHDAMYWVDPSGEACERVEISAPDGFPFAGALRWAPRGSGETATYEFTVDGDGLWMHLDPSFGAAQSGSPGAPCFEHHELRGLTTHGDGLRIGGSAVFESLAACEAERPRTMPFVHRCPAVAEAARPGPLPAGSIAARGGLSGFVPAAGGGCEPISVTLATGFSARSTAAFPAPLEGVWMRGRDVLEVYEWPYSKRLFRRSRRFPARWIAAEPRADGTFALGDEVVYPTEAGCRAAKPR